MSIPSATRLYDDVNDSCNLRNLHPSDAVTHRDSESCRIMITNIPRLAQAVEAEIDDEKTQRLR